MQQTASKLLSPNGSFCSHPSSNFTFVSSIVWLTDSNIGWYESLESKQVTSTRGFWARRKYGKYVTPEPASSRRNGPSAAWPFAASRIRCAAKGYSHRRLHRRNVSFAQSLPYLSIAAEFF